MLSDMYTVNAYEQGGIVFSSAQYIIDVVMHCAFSPSRT